MTNIFLMRSLASSVTESHSGDGNWEAELEYTSNRCMYEQMKHQSTHVLYLLYMHALYIAQLCTMYAHHPRMSLTIHSLRMPHPVMCTCVHGAPWHMVLYDTWYSMAHGDPCSMTHGTPWHMVLHGTWCFMTHGAP